MISRINQSNYGKYLKLFAVAAALTTIPAKMLMRPDVQAEDRFVEQVGKKSPKTVVVADDFVNPEISIDWDFVGDVSHGEVVSTLLENGLPKVNILKRNLYQDGDSLDKLTVATNLNNLLDTIKQDIQFGKKIAAVNLSLGFAVPYQVLSAEARLGDEITPEEVVYMAPYIKENLYKKLGKGFIIQSIPMEKIVTAIKKMDELSKMGVKFYIAAGNSSNDTFSLLTLVDGAVVVGALNDKGKKADYSCDASVVNRWESGEIKPYITDDGYDLTGDSITDFPKTRTTSWLDFYLPYMNIKGTSFAAPRAIIKDLSK